VFGCNNKLRRQNWLVRHGILITFWFWVLGVSSVSVVVAKMALSVHIWLTKRKEGPQYTSFSCLFLAFFTVSIGSVVFTSLNVVEERQKTLE